MAQKKKSTTKATSTSGKTSGTGKRGTARKKNGVRTQLSPQQKELRQELIRWGVVLLLLLLTLGIYLADGMGIVGRGVNSLFVGLFGFSAYVITIYSMIIAILALFDKLTLKLWGKLWFGYAFMLILSAILHVANAKALNTIGLSYSEATIRTGGLIGWLIGGGLAKLFGKTVTIILLVFVMIILIVALTERSLVTGLRIFGKKTKEGTEKVVAFTDEKVAEARLRAEERAAFKDAQTHLEEEKTTGQITLAEETAAPKSSFFKRQKFASVSTDDTSRTQAQHAAQEASLSGKTLSEIAETKGVSAQVENGNTEEAMSAGASRMIAGAQEILPDVVFEKPADLDKAYVPDKTKYKPSSYASPSLTIPSDDQPVQPRVQPMQSEPVYRETSQRAADPVLDIPLIANDAYLEKKRRYLERTNQLNAPISQAPVVTQEKLAAQAMQETLEKAANPVDTTIPLDARTTASGATVVSLFDPAKVSSSAAQAEEQSRRTTILKTENKDVDRSNLFQGLIREENEIKEKEQQISTDIDLMGDDDDGSWDQLLSGAENEAKKQREEAGEVTISTEKMFEKEAFPTGYEERSETAARLQNETEAQPMVKKPGPTGKYVFPPIDLLNSARNSGSSDDQDESMEIAAAKLKKVLNDFGVEIEDQIQVNRGPAVTRFEIKPKTGVKVSRIVSLTDDIAMNLAAKTIRIEAPIPGKSAVGIEVPNKDISMVTLREVLESDAFTKASSKVTFALGRDIDNNCQVADVAKMPHMLIAGATGSGKSVCINSLIVSLLYKADPNDVKLIMVDPKVVELSVYNGIPHLLLPVVNDPKQASATLNWAVQEMTRRYKRFAETNVRNVKGYNEYVEASGDENLVKMPQIVIIIDELADLMMVASKEVEASICRLAQMARAAGMHLVIATQRPSVDVITGLIKANIPSRIAFAVSSGIDSRTILDSVGAEKLLGKGDMLFAPMGSSTPVRIQGTFVSDPEVERVVEFVKEHAGAPVYDQLVLGSSSKNEDGDNGIGDEVDEFLEDAIKFVVDKQKASISMLQRSFRIGFNRAARLMDALEERGVVGEDQGSKPRMVLMTKEEWENENS